MRRRVLLCFVLAAASGCKGGDAVRPIVDPSAPPSRTISDGNHSSGNPDFFFLPPMVADPTGSPNWDATKFDGTFVGEKSPTVTVCRLTATSEGQVATSSCSSDAPLLDNVPAVVNLTSQLYQVNWKVPDVSSTTFYRVSVVLLTNQLGIADIEVVPNASQLKNVVTSEMVPLADNRTLPIKFRIEQGALRTAVATVNLLQGGTVSTTFPGSSLPSGIVIPVQPGVDPNAPLVTITVQPCPDLNPRVTDLRTFGNCVRITSDPAIDAAHPLSVPATVFDCGVDAAVEGEGISLAQERRVTLHRFDDDANGGRLAALPHASACNNPLPLPGQIGATHSPVHGVLASLAHGQFKSAAKQAMSYFAPRPAYAAMFIDLGGGGFTVELSDFQFALPAKMKIVDGSDGIIGDVSTPLSPTVIVTDLGDEPVSGAVVHFFTASPAATGDLTATSSASGLASVPWTISAGANTMVASGRGIAGPSVNGPRGLSISPNGGAVDTYFDPMQPIQDSFDGTGGAGAPVPVLTGSVTFHAIGYASAVDSFGFGGGGYVYMPVPPSGATPSGWEQPSFVPHTDSWTLASAPFGSTAQCADAPAIQTFWPLGTETSPSDILVRKSFVTSQPATLSIQIHIDNDVRVWLDGAEVTSGFFIHENCATLLPPAFTTAVGKGPHVLAVRARDRGGVSFLDIKVQPVSQ